MRHKLLAGIIPFCSGKRKPSLTFTLGSSTTNNMLHSKSTYFYRWSSRYISIAPVACALTLLVGTGLFLNPATKAQEVYAATTSGCLTKPNENNSAYCAMELGIMMNGTNESFTEPSATELKTDAATYREYNFAIRAVDTEDGYKLLAEAVNTVVGGKDYTNQLVNMDDPENSKLVPLTTATAGASIPAGEWGYAFAKGEAIATADKATLEYKAVPTATDTTREIDVGADTIYDDASNTHTDMNYRLYFGARAADNMRSGHYRTQVLLSVVADAKFIGGLGGITRMSQMTTAACKNLHTPSPTAELKDIPTGQLIDDREDPIRGTKYWVAKLADGDCWMIQNMAYDGISNTSGNFNNTKKNTLLVPNNVSNPTSYTEKPTTGYNLSGDPSMTTVLDETTKTYNGHYLLGNYYTQSNNQAANVCTFSNNADWRLPTASSASASGARGSFGRLLGAYNVPNSGSGSLTMRKPPFYFLHAGRYDNGFGSFGSGSYYWSSTSGTILYLDGGAALPSYPGTASYGYSVRCVVSGE